MTSTQIINALASANTQVECIAICEEYNIPHIKGYPDELSETYQQLMQVVFYSQVRVLYLFN